MKTGLTSVTFRQLPAEEIIPLAKSQGLEAIEWGGDVHVPPGDIANAKRIRQMTTDAGLAVSSYGSYWKGLDMDAFHHVLQCALILGAPVIRIWAGNKGSADTDDTEYKLLLENICRACSLSLPHGITIATEYHAKTLTDTLQSTLRLLKDTSLSGLKTYWQPSAKLSFSENLTAIKELSSCLSNIHVFGYGPDNRPPLSASEDHWLRYIHELESMKDDRYMLLEFVKDNDPEQFRIDAAVLVGWVRKKTNCAQKKT